MVDHMSDWTAACGKIFAAYEQICRDLASLANDFAGGIGADTWTPKEYSHSPNKLIAKPAHAWYWDRREEKDGKLLEIEFAAMLAFFQSARTMKKLAPAGRPELWFLAGSVTGPALKPSAMSEQVVAQFFSMRENVKGAPVLIVDHHHDGRRWLSVQA